MIEQRVHIHRIKFKQFRQVEVVEFGRGQDTDQVVICHLCAEVIFDPDSFEVDGAKKKVVQQFTANIREVEKAEPRDLVSDGDE